LFLSFNFKSNGTIYYRPVGRTKKTLAEIQTYVQNHDTIGTIYGVFDNNCQHYVESVVEFLDLSYPSNQSAMKSAGTHGDIDLGRNFDVLNAVTMRPLGGRMNFDPVTMMLNMKRFAEN
jgi:hypothetical protein